MDIENILGKNYNYVNDEQISYRIIIFYKKDLVIGYATTEEELYSIINNHKRLLRSKKLKRIMNIFPLLLLV